MVLLLSPVLTARRLVVAVKTSEAIHIHSRVVGKLAFAGVTLNLSCIVFIRVLNKENRLRQRTGCGNWMIYY